MSYLDSESDEPLELEDDLDGPETDEEVDDLEGFEGEDPVDHGEEDASGEDEGQAGQPDQVDGRTSRRENRVAVLARQAKEAKAENARLRQQLAGRSTAPNPEDQRRAAEAEATRLAMMSPEERIEYRIAQQEERHSRELAQVRFETTDRADVQSFEALCRRNPAAARLKDRVEQALAGERQRGFNYPRETVLKVLIGEQALKNAPRAQNAAQRQAADQRGRQAARPGAGRSDVASQGGRRGDEKQQRYERLKDVNI